MSNILHNNTKMLDVALKNKIAQLKTEFQDSLHKAQDIDAVESIRIRYLGRKGILSQHFKHLKSLSADERPAAGKVYNELKEFVEIAISKKVQSLPQKEQIDEHIDLTLPGNILPIGCHHPLTSVLRQIKSCFLRMGFTIADGPEVETDYYNFEALNIPRGHPARDMQDTFFFDDNTVLRTHTSPVQVRTMEKQQPPVRVISPGKCYRRDTPDATHSPVFHQVEGLCVDEGVTFADLKGVILTFARMMFGSDINIRFRPSFFPFTEPSAEYDFSCIMCKGKGCRVCKGSGWIEISGAGMVNPEVYRYVDYDSEKYTGYAFGMGVERVAMLLHEIDDIRLFYENDIRFLNQF